VTNRFAATTNRGRVRARNEDNFLFVNLTRSSPPLDGSSVTSAGIADQNDVLMILVADGMGGQARGDLASRTVIEHFTRYAEAHSASLLSASGSVKTMQKILCTEVKRCHATLRRRSKWPELRGMGTTATMFSSLLGVVSVSAGCIVYSSRLGNVTVTAELSCGQLFVRVCR